MESQNLHPNWRALATVHFRYKKFVSQGALADISSPQKTPTHSAENITGIEASSFYRELQEIAESSTSEKQPDKTIKPAKKSAALLFDKHKFFLAATTNDVKTLARFRLSSSKINLVDDYGWTALMMASCEGAADAVEFLLSLGANIETSDKAKNNAFTLAMKRGHTLIQSLLESYRTCKQNPEDVINVSDDEVYEKFYCRLCQRAFEETTRREHETSTVHRFNDKTEARRHNRFNIPKTNRGLRIMIKQGWDEDSGLGPRNSGQLYPVKTVIRKQRTGLGIQQDTPKVTHFKPYDVSAIKYKAPEPSKTKKQLRKDYENDKQKERRLRKELS